MPYQVPFSMHFAQVFVSDPESHQQILLQLLTMQIDLGTTYSCVGVWQHDRVEIIPNEQASITMNALFSHTVKQYIIYTGTD